MIVGTTNRMEDMYSAILRRFQRILTIPLPSFEDRVEVCAIRKETRKIDVDALYEANGELIELGGLSIYCQQHDGMEWSRSPSIITFMLWIA